MDNYMDLQGKHSNYALHGKVMLCTGIFLFLALLIILFFHNYSRILLRNSHRRYIRRHAQHSLPISTATPTSTVASKGLNPSVIKTIPTVIYSTKASHFPPLECSVCLSEFQNDEKARVLPDCNHTFHVDCIDMWFHSHSDCPLCRATVQAYIPVNPPKILEEQVVVPLAEAAGLEPPGEDIESSSATASSSSSSSSLSSSSSSPSTLKMESCPKETLGLAGMGILVEVPAREDRLTGVADVG